MAEGEGIQPVWSMNGNNNGWGDCNGMWFMWIIVIIALMGGWGNNNMPPIMPGLGNGLTQAEMQEGFNHQDEMSQIRGITYGLSDGFYAMNTAMLQGQADLGRTVMQGNNGVEKAVLQTGWSISQGLNENRFAQQTCCCETNRNIDSVRADAYRNTCDITTAIHEEAEKTRGLINANTMQDLRDRLADRDRELQTANFNLSQTIQSAAIVNQLRPYPQPAYITASPYQSAGYGTCNGVVV